jgi:osmoprotectant transport system permease protein
VAGWVVISVLLCAGAAHADGAINIGSKRFTESYILGEILKQTAAAAGEASAVHKPGLGNTGIVFAALQSGSIDVYPEYTGTIAREILKDENASTLDDLNRRLAPMGFGVAAPLGFNNTYALAMRSADADRLKIRSLSDLAAHGDLRFGLSTEFIGRADGWPGLKKTYALPFHTPRGIDHGLAFDAIGAGQIDVTDIYSTDAKIEKLHLTVLKDDRGYFPAYDAVLLYRLDLPQRLPKTWKALSGLAGRIDAATMTHLNAEAELGGKDFPVVAAAFLREGSKAGEATQSAARGQRTFLASLFGPDFLRLTGEHLALVFISLAVAIAIGIPLGIYAARSVVVAQPLLALVGLIQTIPSLALLAFLIPLFNRIGTVPALVALFLYALLPIVRNTYTGLMQIAPTLRESALALGLPAGARLRLIELPLALPTILAGIKTSAVINVGTATIAAFIGAGGYGERIATGLALNDNMMLLAGAVPAAALALIVQVAFELADRWLVPAGLRA